MSYFSLQIPKAAIRRKEKDRRRGRISSDTTRDSLPRRLFVNVSDSQSLDKIRYLIVLIYIDLTFLDGNQTAARPGLETSLELGIEGAKIRSHHKSSSAMIAFKSQNSSSSLPCSELLVKSPWSVQKFKVPAKIQHSQKRGCHVHFLNFQAAPLLKLPSPQSTMPYHAIFHAIPRAPLTRTHLEPTADATTLRGVSLGIHRFWLVESQTS